MDNSNIPTIPPVSFTPPKSSSNKFVYLTITAIVALGLAATAFYYFVIKETNEVPAMVAYTYEDSEYKEGLFQLQYHKDLIIKKDTSEITFSNIPITNSISIPKDAYLIEILVAGISNCWDDKNVQDDIKNIYDFDKSIETIVIDGVKSQQFNITDDDTKIVTAIQLEENLIEISFETELPENSSQYKEGLENYNAILNSLKINQEARKKPKTAQVPTKSFSTKHYSNEYVEFDYYDMPFFKDIEDSMKDDGMGQVSFHSDFNCDTVVTDVSRITNSLKLTLQSLLADNKQDIAADAYPERSITREYEVGGRKYILFYKPAFDEEDSGRLGTFELQSVDSKFVYSVHQNWTEETNNQSPDRIDFSNLITNTIKFK